MSIVLALLLLLLLLPVDPVRVEGPILLFVRSTFGSYTCSLAAQPYIHSDWHIFFNRFALLSRRSVRVVDVGHADGASMSVSCDSAGAVVCCAVSRLSVYRLSRNPSQRDGQGIAMPPQQQATQRNGTHSKQRQENTNTHTNPRNATRRHKNGSDSHHNNDDRIKRTQEQDKKRKMVKLPQQVEDVIQKIDGMMSQYPVLTQYGKSIRRWRFGETWAHHTATHCDKDSDLDFPSWPPPPQDTEILGFSSVVLMFEFATRRFVESMRRAVDAIRSGCSLEWCFMGLVVEW